MDRRATGSWGWPAGFYPSNRARKRNSFSGSRNGSGCERRPTASRPVSTRSFSNLCFTEEYSVLPLDEYCDVPLVLELPLYCPLPLYRGLFPDWLLPRTLADRLLWMSLREVELPERSTRDTGPTGTSRAVARSDVSRTTAADRAPSCRISLSAPRIRTQRPRYTSGWRTAAASVNRGTRLFCAKGMSPSTSPPRAAMTLAIIRGASEREVRSVSQNPLVSRSRYVKSPRDQPGCSTQATKAAQARSAEDSRSRRAEASQSNGDGCDAAKAFGSN